MQKPGIFFNLMAGFLLVITFIRPLSAENTDKLAVLDNYRNWGINISANMYSMPEINREYGNIDIHPRRQYGSNWGILYNYNFPFAKQWSLTSGLNLTYYPNNWYEYLIAEEDIPAVWAEGTGGMGVPRRVGKNPAYHFSIPLFLSYKVQVSNRLYFNVGYGGVLQYFPDEAYVWESLIADCMDCPRTRIYTAEGVSAGNEVQGAMKFTSGVHLAMKDALLRINLNYIYTYEDLLSGEYEFMNLVHTAPSGGNFNLKGDYIGLSVTTFFSY